MSTGLIADSNINCDDVEKVGERLQRKLDNIPITEATIPRKEQVKTLSSLSNAVNLQNENANINPVLLFTRLIVLAERYDDIRSYFQYELTAIPTSLFLNNFMRKPNKAALVESLLGKEFQNVDAANILVTKHNVVDGGALLRKVCN